MSSLSDELWNIYNIQKDWISISDAKAVAIIGIYGVIGTILIPDFLSWINSDGFNIYTFIGLTVLLIIPFSSLVLSFLTIIPRLKSDRNNSIIYYQKIAKNFTNPESYYEAASLAISSDNNSYEKEISSQIWNLSKIAELKYRYISFAMILLLLSFILTISLMMIFPFIR